MKKFHRVLVTLVGMLVFLGAIAVAMCARAAERPEATEARGAWTTASIPEIDAAIQFTLSPAPRHHLYRDAEARAAMAETIKDLADRIGVPPYLVVEVIFRESSFDERAIGSRGELGLMQVARRNVLDRGCDMATAAGQVECGTRLLREQFNRCGTWGGALTSYATTTGACQSEDPNVQSKVNLRLRYWQRMAQAVDRWMAQQGAEE